jgi:hypothetical protein
MDLKHQNGTTSHRRRRLAVSVAQSVVDAKSPILALVVLHEIVFRKKKGRGKNIMDSIPSIFIFMMMYKIYLTFRRKKENPATNPTNESAPSTPAGPFVQSQSRREPKNKMTID